MRSEAAARMHPHVRRALATAPDGNDTYDDDRSVHELEERVAAMVGMREALFLPTVRMANAVAAGVLCPEPADVVLDAQAHMVTSEYGMVARLWSLQSRTYLSPTGRLELDQVLPLLSKPENPTLAAGFVAVEDSHLASGGVSQDLRTVRRLSTVARSMGRSMYCDGARFFYSRAADGEPADAAGELYDAISVSLVKGPGAPLGAVAAFAAPCRERARQIRRMVGGAWASPGPLAAAASRALETNLPTIGAHCELAARFHRELADVLGPQRVRQHTNLVLFDVPHSGEFFDWCAERGLLLFRHTPRSMRAVVHADISERVLARAAAIIAGVDSALRVAG